MRSCPRHSRTLAKCLAPSRGHSKTTPQRSAGRAVRSTELVPFSTSDEWYSRHRPVWFRLRRVRERWVVARARCRVPGTSARCEREGDAALAIKLLAHRAVDGVQRHLVLLALERHVM